jgi:hypothetical protein
MFIAQRDAAAARAYVEAHVTDPAQRERILNTVAQFPGLRGGVVDPVTGVLVGPPGALPPTVVCGPASAGACTAVGPMPPAFIGGVRSLPPGFVPGQALPPPQAPAGVTTAPNSNSAGPANVERH